MMKSQTRRMNQPNESAVMRRVNHQDLRVGSISNKRRKGVYGMDQQHDAGKKTVARRLALLKETPSEDLLKLHRERQLRQSLDIMNQLVNENAHRPESIHLLRKILRERTELQVVLDNDETSLSG